MTDEMQALHGQENLEDVGAWDDETGTGVPVDYADTPEFTDEEEVSDADVPAKFRGKTSREIIDMYRNLEADYGRKGQLLGDYEQRLAQYEGSTADDTASDDFDVNAETMRLLPVAQAEYQRLLQLGLHDSPDLQMQAWQYAQQQDAYLQQAINRGVEAQLAPYTEAIAPAIYGRDVQAVLSASPVHGVSAGELAEQIAGAGIPAQEWANADPQQRALFIVTAAKQLAYEKFVRGELAPAGAMPVAPSQDAPAVLGKGQSGARMVRDPKFEREVSNLAETMGLSRAAAVEVLKGE